MKKGKRDTKKEERRIEHRFFAKTKAWELFEEAQQAAEKENFSVAIQLLTRATKSDPHFVPGHIYLGYLYNRENKPQLALSHLWEAKGEDPQNPFVYHYLSDSYLFLDRIEEADDCCEKIISLLTQKKNLSSLEKQIRQEAKERRQMFKEMREEKAKQIAQRVREKIQEKDARYEQVAKSKEPTEKQKGETNLSLEKVLTELNIAQKFTFKENRELTQAIQNKQYQPFDLYTLQGQAAELSLLKGFDHLMCLNQLRGVEKFWYQIEAVRKTLKYFRGRVLLCDEVGLGKTIEAGMILKEYLMRALVRKVLILTPPSLVVQWKDEMQSKFNLNFVTTDDSSYQKEGKLFWKKNAFIIASLHIAKSEKNFEAVSSIDYDLVILDEAHHLKNRRTLSWKFVNSLKKKFILLLTATPIHNNLMELHNLITLLKPGHLQTASSFRKSFVKRGDPRIPENREKLRELLQQVMIRNTRSLANINLPKRYATTFRLHAENWEEEFYSELSSFVKESYLSYHLDRFTCTLLQMEAGSSSQAVASTLFNLVQKERLPPPILNKVNELIQLSKSISTSAKAKKLIEILNKNEDKVIVFTNYMLTQTFLASTLQKEGIPYTLFNGSLSTRQKEENINLFQKKVKVLISTEIGGEGKNMHFCRTMVNYDLPWNPMRIEQRVGRIHRIGQQRDVFIFNLSARGTVEDYLLEILDKKINMFELVIGEMDAILGNLDDSKDFSDILMDIWLQDNKEEEFEKLGEKLIEAKKRYQKIKEYDQQIFQHDYEL
ncbi:DEAD/DEAH box helicase family protein [Candidatus Aerophobetes bacterium]|nr:DEAD/DEAH box helicase family protein [Candidatus Aerophobetes bacterium]